MSNLLRQEARMTIIDGKKSRFEITPDSIYGFEAKKKLKAGFIGCGHHSFMNVYPAFQYLPIDLVGVCAHTRLDRAKGFARQFGGLRAYKDYREMLRKEDLDAVFIVTDYDERGRPRYPEMSMDVMRAGCHVYIEKPPASSSAEIREMMRVSRETGKFVVVGFKHMFFPATQKVREVMDQDEFGELASLYIKYGTQNYPALPPEKDRYDLKGGLPNPAMRLFLDSVVHPLSMITYLGRKVKYVYFEDERVNGGSFTTIRFTSGAVGCLQLLPGQPENIAPTQQVYAIGHGASVFMENGLKVTYYRPGHVSGTNWMAKDEEAPLHWEPEFSFGRVFNRALFIQGYAQEVAYFTYCVLNDTPPKFSSLDDALEVLKLYEAYKNPAGKIININ